MMIDHDPGVIIGEIRDALQIPNSTLTHVVDRMEKKGLVNRVISDRGRRSYSLAMTPKGAGLRKEQKHVLEMISEKMLECLDTEEEKRQLTDLAIKLAKKLGPKNEV